MISIWAPRIQKTWNFIGSTWDEWVNAWRNFMYVCIYVYYSIYIYIYICILFDLASSVREISLWKKKKSFQSFIVSSWGLPRCYICYIHMEVFCEKKGLLALMKGSSSSKRMGSKILLSPGKIKNLCHRQSSGLSGSPQNNLILFDLPTLAKKIYDWICTL